MVTEGDGRDFEQADCWLCGEPARWLVREWVGDGDYLLACEKHKYTAFS